MTKLEALNLEALNIVRPLPLTVDDFLLLDANGAFEGYGKTELIRGEIVFMNAQHSRHGRIKTRLAAALIAAVKAMQCPYEVLVEVSLHGQGSAPMPDICLTSYMGDGLVPVDTVPLAIEISDSTLANDLGPKAGVYAENGIPEYWVVDVTGQKVIQLAAPTDGLYTSRTEIDFGERLAARTLAGLVIDTATLG